MLLLDALLGTQERPDRDLLMKNTIKKHFLGTELKQGQQVHTAGLPMESVVLLLTAVGLDCKELIIYMHKYI